MYKSKFVSQTRMVNGIEVKSKPISKSVVRRLAANLEEHWSTEPSELRDQAIRNNQQRLREMGIKVRSFDQTELKGWLKAYLSDDLEQYETKLLRERSRFPLFEEIFSIRR